MPATLAACQALVLKLQAAVATAVLANLRVGAVCYREYQAAVVAVAATTTLNLTTETGASLDASTTIVDFADTNATLPVDRLLADAGFFATTVSAIGKKVARILDAALLAKVTSFGTFFPLGSAGVSLTDAVALAAASQVLPVSPAGESVYFATYQANTGSDTNTYPYQQLLTMAALVSASQSGEKVLRAVVLGGTLPVYRGMALIPSPDVLINGGGPSIVNNLVFAKNALALLTVQRPLTNDSTNVQGMSELATLGVHIALDYNSANTAQVVHFQPRGVAIASRTSHGCQVRS